MNQRSTSSTDDKQEDEIDLLELARNLWAGKSAIALAAFVVMIFGAILVLRTEPIYQADALLQLEKRSVSLAVPEAMQNLMGDSGGSEVESELEIIRSRLVLSEAVRDLNLTVTAEPRPLPILGLIPKRLALPDPGLGFMASYQWGNEDIGILELEVPDVWLVTREQDIKRKRMRLEITGPDSYEITLPDGTLHDGKLRERLGVPAIGFSLLVEDLSGPVGRVFFLNRFTVEATVRSLQENFAVFETARNSSILRMTLADPDPRHAERVLNAIAQAYVNQNLARSAAEAENSLVFVEEQLPIAQAEVARAEQALNGYRQEQQSVDVEYETLSLLEKATEIEAQLNALSLQEEEVRQRYTVNHPRYKLLIDNRKSLEGLLADIQGETAGLPETQKEIFNLTRDLEVAQEAFVQLLNRAQELRVVRASTVGSARIIDLAFSYGEKIRPKSLLIMGLSGILGTLIGIGYVVVRRIGRKGIRGASDLEKMGLPVFATIDYAPQAAKNRKSKGNLLIHVLTNPDDLVAEGLRSLRTALHFGMLDAKLNVVQFTSSGPGAGKSFTIVNLAVIVAQAGLKVCLVDADLRRGYLRRYFGHPKDTPGLSDVLSNQKTVDEVLLPGPVDGLSVILTGRFPPNPSELLMRAEFEQLLQDLNSRFDLVLVDAPPVLAVTDPVVIGRYAGATIMIVRHIETLAGEVEATRQALVSGGVAVTGAVLNGYRQDLVKHYGGAQHYNYRYSYRSDQDDA